MDDVSEEDLEVMLERAAAAAAVTNNNTTVELHARLVPSSSSSATTTTTTHFSQLSSSSLLLREVARSSLGGLGMLAESYFIFAVGEFSPIWALLFPACYDPDDHSCDDTWATSVTYVEMAAIIVGMILFGFVANKVGRRRGSIMTATTMLCGALLLASSAGSDRTTMMLCNLAILVFGIGVGGEYPLASVAAAERYEAQRIERRDESHNRGRTVVFTFAMQGWGNMINIMAILATLSATSSSNCTPIPGDKTKHTDGTICKDRDLNLTWRFTCALGIIGLLGILIYRIFVMKESAVWLESKRRRNEMDEQRKQEQKGRLFQVLTRYYWSRLFGTTFSWFMLDVALYGNRLYQAAIVSQLVGGAPSLQTTYEYTLLNAVFALAGYYVAAFLVDYPKIGRTRLQTVGFLLMTIFFFASAAVADSAGPTTLQILYYMSSFFSQFPNCTTFLVPAEIFPTQIRSISHGVSAAAGKLGALVVTLVFAFGITNPDNYDIFMVSAASSLVGFVASAIFVPDGGHVELSDLDERFEAELDGDPTSYQGVAIETPGLSIFEIFLGVHHRAQDERGTLQGV